MKKHFRKCTTVFVLFQFLLISGLLPVTRAEMISTQTLIESSTSDQTRNQLQSLIAREDVRKELIILGVVAVGSLVGIVVMLLRSNSGEATVANRMAEHGISLESIVQRIEKFRSEAVGRSLDRASAIGESTACSGSGGECQKGDCLAHACSMACSA